MNPKILAILLAGLTLSACMPTVWAQPDRADSLFLAAAASPAKFDGQSIVIKAWITLRHEDKNLWATWKDHENWNTLHCISLVNYDSLPASLDGAYVQVEGVLRSDSSQNGSLVRLASCRDVALDISGPGAIKVIEPGANVNE